MILGNRFVGRCEEIDTFESLLSRLPDRSGGLLLVSGQAGIGKTSLVRHFHEIARERGALSLWTSYPEQPDCPPYWGWSSLCRGIQDHAPQSGAAALGEAMSQPREVGRGAMHTSYLQRLGEIFASVTVRTPLLLFFDDIQHADRASAALLEALLGEIFDLPVLMVATMRTGDARSPASVHRAVPRIANLPQARRIALRGVDELECAEICRELSGWTPEASIARRLHRQTEGNPLFITQIVQWLVDHGHIEDGVAHLPARLAVPEGISEAILAALARASPDCRRVLEQAAILGRRFDLRVLETLDPDLDRAVLDEADRLRLVRPVDPARGQWEFAHSLVREVVYDTIQPMKRARAHADAATAIESVHGPATADSLAAMAYHAFEGQLFYGAERVIGFAVKAAHHALSVGAYEDAAAHNTLALECCTVPGVGDTARRIDIALDLALAERLAGENVAAIRTCRSAMEMAKGEGDWPRYAKAALLYEAARWQPGLPSTEIIKCLEIALVHRDSIEADDIARIHYSLARAYQWQGAQAKVREHALTSIRIADELGDDALICEALDQGGSAIGAIPGSLPLRAELNERGLSIARTLGDRQRLANLLVNAGVTNCEAGRMDVLRDTYRELGALARDLSQPHLQYVIHQWAVTIAMLEGDFTKASKIAATGVVIGRRISGASAAGVYGIQMFLLQREAGTLGKYAPMARRIGAEKAEGLWRPGYALLLAETGDIDEARSELNTFLAGGGDAVPVDDLRKVTLAFLAEVAALTADEAASHALFEKLVGEAGTVAVAGPAAICFGPIDRVLGRLKTTLKDFEAAREWLERAREQVAAWDSPPAQLRVDCDYCETLLADGSPEAVKRARQIEDGLAERAAAAGMASLAVRAKAISAELHRVATTHGFDSLTGREVEVLRVLADGASNAEISRRLGISPATTATHVRSILAKTDCKNRTAAAAFAQRTGLVR